MIKTINHPDGTVETLEGSPEEIVDYELRSTPVITIKKSDVPTPSFPLTGPLPIIGPGLYESLKIKWEHSEQCPITIAQRGWFSIHPPVCNCGAIKTWPTINTNSVTLDSTNPLSPELMGHNQ